MIGVLFLLVAALLFFFPIPQRTLSYSYFDFVVPFERFCRYSAPFNAHVGELVTTDFHYFYLWNDSVVGSFNGTAEVATANGPRNPVWASDLPSVNLVYQIPADGQYVVGVSTTIPLYVRQELVNATVIAYGSLTIATPGGYVLTQESLSLLGAALFLAPFILRRRPKRPAEEATEATSEETAAETRETPEP